jgi:hypothetical protein
MPPALLKVADGCDLAPTSTEHPWEGSTKLQAEQQLWDGKTEGALQMAKGGGLRHGFLVLGATSGRARHR